MTQARPSTSKYLEQQIRSALAATNNSSMSEIKTITQAPPMTMKPKTKKSMGTTHTSISGLRKTKTQTDSQTRL